MWKSWKKCKNRLLFNFEEEHSTYLKQRHWYLPSNAGLCLNQWRDGPAENCDCIFPNFYSTGEYVKKVILPAQNLVSKYWNIMMNNFENQRANTIIHLKYVSNIWIRLCFDMGWMGEKLQVNVTTHYCYTSTELKPVSAAQLGIMLDYHICVNVHTRYLPSLT